jgi:hypothetical protein
VSACAEVPDERHAARAAVNAVAIAHGLPAPWSGPARMPAWAAGADLSAWGVVELGELRQHLLDDRQRQRDGVVYTPPELVEFQVRSRRAAHLPQLANEPRPLDHLLIHDPFCGPGIYLVHSARMVATWLLDRAGLEDTTANRRWLTAEAFVNCIFGTDLDPVSVDLARAACWLEVGSPKVPITFMDDNIAAGDTFAGYLPPALEKRWPHAWQAPEDAP